MGGRVKVAVDASEKNTLNGGGQDRGTEKSRRGGKGGRPERIKPAD